MRDVRIVVASPSDVQAERDLLPGVLEELNRNFVDRGIRLELSRWETDAYPGFHPDGPQGLIDPLLRIEECDLLIGIFWKRFGTPTKEAQSGTEHEFRRAYAAWQQHQRPQIMVYFNQKAYAPKTSAELEQWQQVLKFQENFPKEGLWWPYKSKPQFEKLVRTHLSAFLRQQLVKPAEARPSPPIAGPSPAATTPPTALRESYLNWLIEQVRSVPLTGVDPKSIREETRRDLDLAAVYTALMTQRPETITERTPYPERDQKRLSALAVLNTEPRLALLGDPGSGKTTFVNFLALCMAGELLHNADANLQVLRTPVPDDDEGRSRQEKPQPWRHGALLPLRVTLREFVARGLAGVAAQHTVNSDTLWHFLVMELPETLREFAASLRSELLTHGGLLLLDGLDEVPEADERRVQVKTAVEQFAAAFPKVRILVTSRTYAYQKQDWKLKGFAEAVLAPFSAAQIRTFVERWYAYVGPLRKLRDEDAHGRATLLNAAIKKNPRLFELATRPLLLTLMASLHAWRGGMLPEQREELYADAVELLLDQWESQKLERKPDGTYVVSEPSLGEWLRVDHKAMRQFLNRLACDAHQNQPILVGTADIGQEALAKGLLSLTPTLDANPGQLIAYLRDRAGILEPRGVGIYAFPHRTFQEYLAACHLTDQADFPDNVAKLLKTEPNRWREVTLLAGAKAVRGSAANAWMLAEALCFDTPPEQKTVDERGYWGALLAAQVLSENKSLETIAERNREKVERIRGWLTCTLKQGALPPVDRAQAGDVLAKLGDPRFRADTWYLPDEPLLGFVEIPAGPFLMGSDERQDSQAYEFELPQHSLSLPVYYIARYPVTVAQFRAFVEHSGYQPRYKDCLQGLANHPVGVVTWHDALAYCRWLTERLQRGEGIPEAVARQVQQEGWEATLPSEAEWEKAARGADGRMYPWGNGWQEDHANTGETGIGSPSAVGSFPQGASPYGCLDLAGNMWEWTRSLWGEEVREPKFSYPYNPADGRENLRASDNVYRVLRGGAYFDSQGDARCAFRLGAYPDGGGVGFRVVALPKTLNSELSGL